jgi:hypothetical protein
MARGRAPKSRIAPDEQGPTLRVIMDRAYLITPSWIYSLDKILTDHEEHNNRKKPPRT